MLPIIFGSRWFRSIQARALVSAAGRACQRRPGRSGGGWGGVRARAPSAPMRCAPRITLPAREAVLPTARRPQRAAPPAAPPLPPAPPAGPASSSSHSPSAAAAASATAAAACGAPAGAAAAAAAPPPPPVGSSRSWLSTAAAARRRRSDRRAVRGGCGGGCASYAAGAASAAAIAAARIPAATSPPVPPSSSDADTTAQSSTPPSSASSPPPAPCQAGAPAAQHNPRLNFNGLQPRVRYQTQATPPCPQLRQGPWTAPLSATITTLHCMLTHCMLPARREEERQAACRRRSAQRHSEACGRSRRAPSAPCPRNSARRARCV